MKKALYFILLAAELFVGSLLMISLWESALYVPCVIAIVAMLAGVVWQGILLAKATDPLAKRKLMRNVALFMLIPTAVFFVTYVVIAILFIFAFAA